MDERMPLNVIAFDLIGTILHVKPDTEKMITSLKIALEDRGLTFRNNNFRDKYKQVNNKYMKIRAVSMKEYSNPVILAETVTELGYPTTPNNPIIIDAIKEYFKPYLESIYIVPKTYEVLENLSKRYTMGIVTNFTFQWPVHEGLKKVALSKFFNPIVVSADVGWRKPHPYIFKAFSESVKIDERKIIFVGDDIKRDIYGAHQVGMKTVLVSSGITATEDIFYDKYLHTHMNKDTITKTFTPHVEIKSLTELENVLKTF
jgi:putative hydrolase of the HAD superfamily